MSETKDISCTYSGIAINDDPNVVMFSTWLNTPANERPNIHLQYKNEKKEKEKESEDNSNVVIFWQ